MVAAHSFKLLLVSGTALTTLGFALPAQAQTQSKDDTTQEAVSPTGAALPVSDQNQDIRTDPNEVLVTGSRIKQDPNRSALPLQIVTSQEIQRNGISSPEQLIMFLSSNGSGADNLASNADVTTGAQRGTNGLSAANLRGQGSAATLVLLNGRRVAAHGLSGSAVDVNQIPFAAIERVEVLKDGASAIYGTDAIGGVINFITKKDFKGLQVDGFNDITQHGGGNIYRVSGTTGFGDLSNDGFNIMGAVSYSWNEILRGSQRAFVNGNQPNRGLSIDTRGTPIATMFPLNPSAAGGFPNGTLLGGTSGATVLPGLGINGAKASGGINTLNLPGGAGCGTMDGGMAYDAQLWNAPTAQYACAWDTGRAAVIQQPIETLTYYARGVARIGGLHEVSIELTGSDANSAKSFSNAQVSGNTSNLPLAYPLNSLTATTYNQLYNALITAFPNAGIQANYGKPIAYRWRCVACGTREYKTESKTFRAALAAEGPLFKGWDYRAGASYARSDVTSVLGTGYYYRGTLGNGAPDPSAPTAPGASAPGLFGLLNSGILNPFTFAQTPQAISGLNAVSAAGTTLYGGRYEVRQFDGSVSGPLFRLPGGEVQVAAGVDYRRETYTFNGSAAAAATAPTIFLAAFDNVNALQHATRDVKAAYAEVSVPLLPELEVTGAARVDDYSGFGSTTNPKISVKFTPFHQLMFRGSYNTGFRVPSFNQIFNGVTESPYSGSDLVDPVRCPSGVASATDPKCVLIRPNIWTGGNLKLGPETAKEFSVGGVLQPIRNVSLTVDWWSIAVDNTIQLLTLTQLIQNASLFPQNFIRDPSTNEVVTIDDRWVNAGSRRTQGIDFTARAGFDLFHGQFITGLDGTLLLKKREKLTPNAPYGPSLIGVYTTAGDIGNRWKHNAFIGWSNENVAISLSQIFRSGYKNQALPGIAAGTVTRPDYNQYVSDYVIYNLSVTYKGLAPHYTITAGIRNLFDTDPPFAITYDGNSGAGSSWEPRVADPRGRSFTLSAQVKF